jgi:hypothetical protein
MNPRTRDTVATRRRMDNLRIIIDTITTVEMELDDICALLGFSPSGGRKYIQELRGAGVIELARYVGGTDTYLGRPHYRLSPHQALVSAFLSQLDPLVPAPPRKPAGKQPTPALPGSSIHLMTDDTYFSVRVNRAPAVRDPLVAALFGDVGRAVP